MASSYKAQFAGDTYFGQSGTNIPSFGVQSGWQGGSGTDIAPYYNSYTSNAPAPNSFLQGFINDQLASNIMGSAGSEIRGGARPGRQPAMPGEQQELIQDVYGAPKKAKQQQPALPGFLQLPPA
jgi:hypothetical protein